MNEFSIWLLAGLGVGMLLGWRAWHRRRQAALRQARADSERVAQEAEAQRLAGAEAAAEEQAAAARAAADLAESQAELERVAAAAEVERVAAGQAEIERVETERVAATQADALRSAQDAAHAEAERQAAIAASAEAERLARIQAEAEAERAAAQAAAAKVDAERIAEERRSVAAEQEAEAQAQVQLAEAARRDAERIASERLAADRRAAEAQAQAERRAIARAESERLDAAQAEALRTPVVVPALSAPPPAKHAAQTLVMVADDSKVVRVKTGRLLTAHQYQVCYAGDGLDAAQQLQAATPDVVITDVEMPGMDGFELTRHIRGNAATAHIPVIMITAADDRHREQAAQAGVSVLLGKPYPEDALIAHIRLAMGSRPDEPPAQAAAASENGALNALA